MTNGLLGGTDLILSPARVIDVWKRSVTAKTMNLRLIIFIEVLRCVYFDYCETMGLRVDFNSSSSSLR